MTNPHPSSNHIKELAKFPDANRSILQHLEVCKECRGETDVPDANMTSQPTLWTIKKPKKTIRERFTTFHNGNPNVYESIVEIARQMRGRGVHKMGISLVFERLRWLHFIEVNSDEGFKLSNDFRAEYARLIMTREPDLNGFFETRALRRQS